MTTSVIASIIAGLFLLGIPLLMRRLGDLLTPSLTRMLLAPADEGSWEGRWREEIDRMIANPAVLAIWHVKHVINQGILNWATILAMTGLIIHAVNGVWTALSGTLLVVGVIYFAVNYVCHIYLVLTFRLAKEQQKASKTEGLSGARQSLASKFLKEGLDKMTTALSMMSKGSNNPPETRELSVDPNSTREIREEKKNIPDIDVAGNQ